MKQVTIQLEEYKEIEKKISDLEAKVAELEKNKNSYHVRIETVYYRKLDSGGFKSSYTGESLDRFAEIGIKFNERREQWGQFISKDFVESIVKTTGGCANYITDSIIDKLNHDLISEHKKNYELVAAELKAKEAELSKVNAELKTYKNNPVSSDKIGLTYLNLYYALYKEISESLETKSLFDSIFFNYSIRLDIGEKLKKSFNKYNNINNIFKNIKNMDSYQLREMIKEHLTDGKYFIKK